MLEKNGTLSAVILCLLITLPSIQFDWFVGLIEWYHSTKQTYINLHFNSIWFDGCMNGYNFCFADTIFSFDGIKNNLSAGDLLSAVIISW